MLVLAIGALIQIGSIQGADTSPLTPLPTVLRGREDEFTTAWSHALKRLEAFARDHNLDPPDLGDVRLTVVATQKELVPGPFPTRRTMVAHAGWKWVRVVPLEVFAEVLPEYARLREDAWARVLAHELSHSWIRRGPRWFREGLAIVAADQGIGEDIRLTSPDPALASIDWRNDSQAYPRSAAQVRFYMERIPLRELLAKAGSPEFETWLRDRWQTER